MSPIPFAFMGGYTPPGTAYLLDVVGSAYGAYSVARKLRAAYGGSAIRVRRASDSTEQDIGFSGEGIDAASLTSFCSGTDGFLRTIYDQSGNARDLTQSTAANQPQIVSSGSILTGSNSKPCLRLDGSDDTIGIGSLTQALPVTYFLVVNNISTQDGDVLVRGSTTTRLAVRQGASGPRFRANSGLFLDSTVYSTATWYLVRAHFKTGTDGIGLDDAASNTGAAGDNSLIGLAIGDSSLCPSAEISEWIVYPSDVGGDAGQTPATGDDAAVISNINAFYSTF